MSVNVLVERAQVLQAETQRAKLNVVHVTEQLEQAKNHLSQVTGHLNEVAYLLSEAQKDEQLKAAALAQANALSQENLGDKGDGDANEQKQEQTTQE